MIKKTMKVILASAIMFTAFNASAQVRPSSVGTITALNSGGGFVIVSATSVVNAANVQCEQASIFVLQEENNSNFNATYAALLTAYAADREVRLGTEGCFAPGGQTFPIIQSIILQ